ncbi:MAG TPA: magnesium/cobalt transporter CorA, partial [Methanoregulaceae archaeon]|nr:magnesium/cobalt transporter CorA [Methanoregulaceae archaeon]
TPDGVAQREPVRITVIDYDAASLREMVVSGIEECLQFRDTGTVTWIHIDGLENTKVIEDVGRHFDIHSLILEDILSIDQRPKMEDLDHYLYVNLKMMHTKGQNGDIRIEHISMIIGPDYVISFQEEPSDVFDPVRDRIRKNGKIRKFGPDYLAYSLIDNIVDNYFVVIEYFEDKIEDLEEELVTNATRELLVRINRLKKDMIYLRKSVWPLREVVTGLMRTDSPLIQESTSIYLRDVYDHTIQVIDTLETFRDIISGMIDIYLSSISFRMNEIMKVLTLIATIFIPLTFVAGIYGMNFRYMPELEWEYGYYVVWIIMLAIVAAMLAYFRKKSWI